MVWETISPKSGNSSPPEMYCAGKIYLLLVKLLKNLLKHQSSPSTWRPRSWDSLLISYWVDSTSKDQTDSKIKQMANSTVSRSNVGIKMLPAGSLMALILTGVYSGAYCFLSNVFSISVYKRPSPFYEYLCHRSIYYT